MKKEKRQDLIMYAVMRSGFVSIDTLSEDLGVSPQTIRRDLDLMDRNGMLERVHGGASCRTSTFNSSYEKRQVEELREKERIGRRIAEYIPDNCSVFLTLGTTVEVIANALLAKSGLMIITNNTVAALNLNKKADFEVVLASGYMRKSSHGLVGASTIDFINGFQCDYLITSAGGINAKDGCLVDFHNADASVTQVMMKNSKKILLALSPDKFDRNAVIRMAPLKSIDALFTCPPVPRRLEELCREADVELIES